MAVTYLKRASKTPESESASARAVVAGMLAEIDLKGEAAVKAYAEKLDGWTGDIVMSSAEIEERTRDIPAGVARRHRVRHRAGQAFALAQRESITEFAVEVHPGLVAGQRLIPVNVAGCYVPSGRYAHIASAIMSITTAKAAGVPFVVACSPPFRAAASIRSCCTRWRSPAPT